MWRHSTYVEAKARDERRKENDRMMQERLATPKGELEYVTLPAILRSPEDIPFADYSDGIDRLFEVMESEGLKPQDLGIENDELHRFVGNELKKWLSEGDKSTDLEIVARGQGARMLLDRRQASIEQSLGR